MIEQVLKGAAQVVMKLGKAIADRVLFPKEERSMRQAQAFKDFSEGIVNIAAARKIDLETLKATKDLLVECGVPEARVQELIERDVGRMLGLASDIAALKKYAADGTIIELRVKEEEVTQEPQSQYPEVRPALPERPPMQPS